MNLRHRIVLLACAAGHALPASAAGAHSIGSREQVSWVRRAAGNFVAAELAGNGAGVCAVLDAPLRASVHHRSCAQRWNAKLATMLGEPGGHGSAPGRAAGDPLGRRDHPGPGRGN